MTPLQEAAKAAKDKQLGLNVCVRCQGFGACFEGRLTCAVCSGCGVDTSDPRIVLAEALSLLLAHSGHIEIREDDVLFCATFGKNGQQLHDGTAESLATALLCLVARCVP